MTASDTTAAPRGAALATMGLLFFVMGFFTWINGPLITFVQFAFDLDEVNAFLILMAFYLSYFCFALPGALVLRVTGMKRGIAAGLLVVAAGAVLFGESSTARWYPGALTGLFVIGSGLALLQTAVNPYVVILGPIESAARRIALMGICNKLAGIVAPLLVGALVLHGLDDLSLQLRDVDAAARDALLDAFAASVRLPYLAMAAILVACAAGIACSSLPDLRAAAVAGAAGREGLFRQGQLWRGVLCLFLYVGVEVMAGDAIGTYGKALGLPLEQTRFFTAFTLAAMLLGYAVGVLLVPRRISQQAYLALSAALGAVLCIAVYGSGGYLAIACIAALGFANAMMWPAIFPLSIRGLGRLTETGSALLIMGIAGGALIPQLFAVAKQLWPFREVFLALMLPCYAYIGYFAWRSGRDGEKA